MKEFIHDTILIDKESYFYLRNNFRVAKGFKPLSIEALERIWKRLTYGNDDTEHYRIDIDTFGYRLETIKILLIDNGYDFIDDGIKNHGFYLSL